MATLPMALPLQTEEEEKQEEALTLLAGTPVEIRAMVTSSTRKGRHKPTIAPVGHPQVLPAAAQAQHGAACVHVWQFLLWDTCSAPAGSLHAAHRETALQPCLAHASQAPGALDTLKTA